MSQGMGGFRYWLYIWQVAVSLPRSGLLEPDISAESKGHGISAKAPWEAVFMLSPPLNSLLCASN
jgi:hypothetical protein